MVMGKGEGVQPKLRSFTVLRHILLQSAVVQKPQKGRGVNVCIF